MRNGLNDSWTSLTQTARSILILAALIVPMISVSFTLGVWFTARGIRDDVHLIETRITRHIENPELHVMTAAELVRINRRLCLLMRVENISDANCPITTQYDSDKGTSENGQQ